MSIPIHFHAYHKDQMGWVTLNQRVGKYLKSVSVSTDGGTGSEDSGSDELEAEALSVEVGNEMDKMDKKPLIYFCGWDRMIREGRDHLSERGFEMMKDIRVEIFG